jgi:exoribonuclease R
VRRERALARNTASKEPSEKQPTGKVVGVIKRNWRAYVALFFNDLPQADECLHT